MPNTYAWFDWAWTVILMGSATWLLVSLIIDDMMTPRSLCSLSSSSRRA
jgi:hypothetical protein